MTYKKKKFSRRTLKKISWIFRHELPYFGWYDVETDEIPVLIDNFVHTVWKAFYEQSFVKFRKMLIVEIVHVILHEIIHYITQPANERPDMDVFPADPKKTQQENLVDIEEKVDLAAMVLVGMRRTHRIIQINLGICRETLEELEGELFD